MAGNRLDLDQVREAVLAEIRRRARRDGVSFRYWRRWPGARLYAALDVLHLWRTFGASELEALDRPAWVRYINAHQRSDGDYANLGHDRYHRFAYALGALRILGGRPSIRPVYLAPTDPAALRAYLAGLPWRRSIQKQLWGALYPLACTPEVGTTWADVLVQELAARWDPDTAWQRTRRSLPDWRYVSQVYHVLLSFDALGRPFPHAEALLDCLLARRIEEGQVFLKPRTSCTEMDWLWLMEKLGAQCPARRGRVWPAIGRMADALLHEWSSRPQRFTRGTTHDLAAFATALARLGGLFPARFAGSPLLDSWNDHALYGLPSEWVV